MTLIGVLLMVLMIVYIKKTVTKPKNYPPGPRWYPLLGCNNIIHARTRKFGSQWKAIKEIAKEYRTQVLGLKMGSELVVAVYGEKNVHFVSENMDFDARPDNFFIRLRTFGKINGITFVDGLLWRDQRQFTFKGLKNEGFGKRAMEYDIQKEIDILVNTLRKSNKNPVDITTLISIATINLVWKYVAGFSIDLTLYGFFDLWFRVIGLLNGPHIASSVIGAVLATIEYKYKVSSKFVAKYDIYTSTYSEPLTDCKLKKFVSLMSSRSRMFTIAGGWLNQWPWLRFIAPKWTGFSIIEEINEQLVEIIQEAIFKHIKKTVEGSDFMYNYLIEMYNEKKFFSEEQLTGICIDLLIASTQTTSSVFGFAVITLLRNRDMYDRIVNEINTVLGNEPPRTSDYTRLVYTSAFLYEIQRKFTITPFSGPRRALRDTIIDGHYIPKGTTILISIGDVHSDPTLWDEPDELKPERFIDENGSLKNIASFYPFGVGRRACPGRPLAKSFLFLVFVSVIQKFKVECCNGILPSDEPFMGFFAEPRPFTSRFIEII